MTSEAERDKYVFFYGHSKGDYRCFSQFYPCTFVGEDKKTMYNGTEQWMHHKKALLFKDVVCAAEIMASSDPARHKKLGREVEPFDKATWEAKAYDIVVRGNRLKFGQNAALRDVLMSTGRDTVLVEASPRDKIWGIGLSADKARRVDASQWRGQNLLGKALTQVRDEFFAADDRKNTAQQQQPKPEKKKQQRDRSASPDVPPLRRSRSKERDGKKPRRATPERRSRSRSPVRGRRKDRSRSP
jgi:ribA/ribD-fused uncharacterized protein